jgi:hypothetical protein
VSGFRLLQRDVNQGCRGERRGCEAREKPAVLVLQGFCSEEKAPPQTADVTGPAECARREDFTQEKVIRATPC